MDKKVLRDLTYGLYAIGVKENARNCGCIVNTVFQITNDIPRIAISMNKENYTNELILKNKRFSVSILSEKTNPIVISKLGFVSGKDHDKWDGFLFEEMDHLPIVKENALGHMICEVESVSETSTHNVIIAKVINAKKDMDENAMTYVYYHEVIKGKAPKKAPTYEEVEKHSENEAWVCSICGYVYDGDDFEKESDDYVCPLCGVNKELFEKKKVEIKQEEKKMEEKKWVCSVCGWIYDGENFENEAEDFICPLCGVPKLMFEEE